MRGEDRRASADASGVGAGAADASRSCCGRAAGGAQVTARHSNQLQILREKAEHQERASEIPTKVFKLCYTVYQS